MIFKNIQKDNSGMTLIELIVSMAIFSIVMTLTVGFFLRLQVLQGTYRASAEMQQEGKIASEALVRLVGAADEVTIYDGDGDGDICSPSSSFTAANLGYSQDNYLKIKTNLGSFIFACNKEKNYTKLKSGLFVSQVSSFPPTPAVGDQYFDLVSEQVGVKSFKVQKMQTYPESLQYDMEVAKVDKDGNFLGQTGDSLHFRGYLTLK